MLNVKAELLRMQDGHKKYRRAYELATRYGFKRAGDIMGFHVNTVRQYAKIGHEELKYDGTLFHFLSTRVRSLLVAYGVDPFSPNAAARAREVATVTAPGIGAVSRNEILNAVDEFLELQGEATP